MHTRRQLLFLSATALLLATCAAAFPSEARAQEEAPVCTQSPKITPLDPTEKLSLHRTTEPKATNLRVLRVLCGKAVAVQLLTPELSTSWRGGVPDPRGTSTATPGIGTSWQIRGGAEFRRGMLFVRVAPEISWTANSDFLIFPGRDTTRSSFASHFYYGARSADLPSRFGDRPTLRIDLGESGIWVIGKKQRTYFAATTALPDWGPGVGEGLVLGRTAAGIPRIEAGFEQPTPIGAVTLRWFTGAASESRFFDTLSTNNVRPMGGLRVAFEREQFAVGFSRTVMDGRAEKNRDVLSAALHPLTNVGTDSLIDFLSADLLLRNAESGTLGWIELARQAPISAMRDFLLLPTEGLALRVGFSHRLVVTPRARWILGLEAVRLDQPAQRTDHPQQDLYTSPTVAQGWTHRGKPLGSGLGPGGQRQFISVDREGSTWAIGGFVERARWNDDALYREFLPYHLRHDVTLQLGGRAARRWRAHDIAISMSVGKRLNYLFQNDEFLPGYRTSDILVTQLGLALTPAR